MNAVQDCQNAPDRQRELPAYLGQHQGHSLGGASGGGHDVEGGSAGAAQVTVGGIQQALVAGVGVGGGHGALDDAWMGREWGVNGMEWPYR